MCDCINKLVEHYEKEIPGGIEIINSDRVGRSVDGVFGDTEERPPLMRFKYYESKNGKITKKVKRSFFTQNYCTFCGVKY